MPPPIRLSLFSRWSTKCGIADYSQTLMEHLAALPEIEHIHRVEAPPDAIPNSTKEALLRYLSEERRFQSLGATMADNGSSLAHIQHQYFFFGGVAPHKNHCRALLNGIKVPVVLTVHEVVTPSPSASLLVQYGIQHTNRANFLHPAIKKIVVHTEQDRERLLKIGVAENRVQVMRLAIPTPSPLPPKETAKAEWGLSAKQVLTIFGFLSQKKGHSIAIEAIQHLPKNVVLILAGGKHPDDNTDYVPSLHHLVERLDLKERILFTDYLPQERLPSLMAATDIALAPFHDTSGSASLSFLLAHGLPVLASPIPPHQEIQNEVPNCIALTQNLTPEALAHHAHSLLQNPDLQQSLHNHALLYAHRHSFHQVARETLTIYHEVLNSR
jgi:glycosyltransferase involved in cell wall biosynthesis